MGTERLIGATVVGELFDVDPKTVTRWAKEGRIGYVRTPSGRRKYRESDVRKLLEEGYKEAAHD